MKQRIKTTAVLITITIFSLSLEVWAGETNSVFKLKAEDVIASVLTNNVQFFQPVATEFDWERKLLIRDLLNVFRDSKSTDLQKACVADYMGQMRAIEAADILASQISLQAPQVIETMNGFSPRSYSSVVGYPVPKALIEIGVPSVPALIRNLEESDDAKARELSLKVLYRIEGDTDIAQLRLQKALAAEKDSQKQARLQSALKTLAETSFAN